jgi:hypothetical protein
MVWSAIWLMANFPWQTAGCPDPHGGTRSRPFPDRDVVGGGRPYEDRVCGIHHFVSTKHLDRYLGEFTFRYNRPQAGEHEQMNDFFGRTSNWLTYEAGVRKRNSD